MTHNIDLEDVAIPYDVQLVIVQIQKQAFELARAHRQVQLALATAQS